MENLTVFADPGAFAEGAAALIVDLARAAVADRGRFMLALAGGGTPGPVHARLASPVHAGRMPWDQVQVFFGDERCVPPDDERSNYRLAKRTLLDQVPLPVANIHRIAGEDVPAAAARAYEQDLRRTFGGDATPVFDLVCLGMGADGHTASLFPGTAALHEPRRWVVSQYVPELAAWRVTMTPVLLDAARNVVFLVTGAAKAATLARVLEGSYEPDLLPAQLVRPVDGRVHWLVDAAAAGRTGR